MKKFFKENLVAKLLGILFIVSILLTWIVPSSEINGAQIVKGSAIRIGFSDLPVTFSTAMSFILDKIVFIIAIAIFYGVLSNTKAYKKIINNITKKFKGKELAFVIGTTFTMTLLSTMLSQTYVMLIFVPFLFTIIVNLKLNKITAFASTVGAILLGSFGALYGTEGLMYLSAYLTKTDKLLQDSTIIYRLCILLVAFGLYVFFLYFNVKSQLTSKKSKKEDLTNDEFIVEEIKDKKIKLLPIKIVLILLTLFIILGFINWNTIFGIKAFDNFHAWLNNLKIGKDFYLVSYILGANAQAFGQWTLYQMSVVLIVLSIFTSILYSIKIDEFIENSSKAITKALKPIIVFVFIYTIFIVIYLSGITPTIAKHTFAKDNKPQLNIDYNGAGIAFFNIDQNDDGKADYNLINQDLNNDHKCDLNCDTDNDGFPDAKLDFNADKVSNEIDENIKVQLTAKSYLNLDIDEDGKTDINIDNSFNLPKMLIGSIIIHTFNVEVGYTGYVLSAYLQQSYTTENISVVFMVLLTVFGLIQFIVPTATLLILGIEYTGVSYKEWIKYIWRFVLGMLLVLLLIFICMLIL